MCLFYFYFFFTFLKETINEHKKNYTSGKQDDLIDMFLDEMYKEGSSTEIFTGKYRYNKRYGITCVGSSSSKIL